MNNINNNLKYEIINKLKYVYKYLNDKNYDEVNSAHQLPINYFIISKFLQYKLSDKLNKLLDVSIGFGHVSRVLEQYGFNIYGIDSSKISGDLSKRFRGSKIKIIDVDIEKNSLPFKNNSFDYIYWGATIEHIHNSPKHPMDEIYRVLKKGGIFIIDTPNIISLKHRMLMASGISFMPSVDYVYHSHFHGAHHREYTMQDLIKVCKWTEYELLEKTYVDTFWSLSLKKMGKLGINRSTEKERSIFDIGFKFTNWYDWVKLPALGLCKLFPSLRETLVIICRK